MTSRAEKAVNLMSPDKKTSPSANTNISIGRDVSGVVVVGNENTVNQTIIQKFFNIFKSDLETLEQRNHRILLGHVENAWIKGMLDASLHGAALLDLGIKQDPEAVTKYPWAIKTEKNMLYCDLQQGVSYVYYRNRTSHYPIITPSTPAYASGLKNLTQKNGMNNSNVTPYLANWINSQSKRLVIIEGAKPESYEAVCQPVILGTLRQTSVSYSSGGG